MSAYDVIVVGARCAGSPLATMLSRAGMRVCLVDRATFPSDSPSTHGILPPGVKILDRLGVFERLCEVATPVDDMILALGEDRVELDGITRLVGAPTINVRRVTLDAILLDVAASAGVEVRTGSTVTGLIESGGRVTGVETTTGSLRAPLVIGADGARSTVARLVGAAEYHRTAPRRIFLWSYFEGVDEAERRVWIGNIGSDGFLASPTDAGLFLAAFVTPIERRGELRGSRDAAYQEGLTRWPELAELLAGRLRAGPVRMMSRWHGYFRESAGPGWVLVGDAGHFKDPTPGQGISDALRQSDALVPAIEKHLGAGVEADEPLREWWAWRDREAWEMYWFAQDMGETERAPMLLRAFQSRVASEPRLVEGLLRVLGRDLSPSKMLTPPLIASVLTEELRARRGERLRLLGETRTLAIEEVRRWSLHASGLRRPGAIRRSASPFRVVRG